MGQDERVLGPDACQWGADRPATAAAEGLDVEPHPGERVGALQGPPHGPGADPSAGEEGPQWGPPPRTGGGLAVESFSSTD